MFRVTAIDSAGNITTKEVAYMVNSTDVTMPTGAPTASVDTALALSFPTTSPSFGAFTPGVAREYLTSGAFRVTSTAGNAAITVHDPADDGHRSPRQRHGDADERAAGLRVVRHRQSAHPGRRRRRWQHRLCYGPDVADQLHGAGHEQPDRR